MRYGIRDVPVCEKKKCVLKCIPKACEFCPYLKFYPRSYVIHVLVPILHYMVRDVGC